MTDEQVTIGEVYRLCLRIESKVDKTNGRVTALEQDAIRIKTFWTAAMFIIGFCMDFVKDRLFGG